MPDNNTRESKHLTPEERIALQAEEIKQLQKENNGWQERYDELDAGHSRLFKDFCKLQQKNEQLRTQLAEWKYETKCHIDEVVAREKQIEQLQTQITRMKEALQKAKETINTKDKAHWFECDRCRDIRDALTAIDILERKKNV